MSVLLNALRRAAQERGVNNAPTYNEDLNPERARAQRISYTAKNKNTNYLAWALVSVGAAAAVYLLFGWQPSLDDLAIERLPRSELSSLSEARESATDTDTGNYEQINYNEYLYEAETVSQNKKTDVVEKPRFTKDAAPKPALKNPRQNIASNPAAPTLIAASNSVADNLLNAYAAYQRGDWADAENSYAAVLKQAPQNRDAHLGLAALATTRNQIELAETHYLHVWRKDKNDIEALAGLISINRLPQALDNNQARELLAKYPQQANLQIAVGHYYARDGQWLLAQQAYNRAFSVANNNPDYAYNLAISYDQLNQKTNALQFYRSALELAKQRPATFASSAVENRIQQLASELTSERAP
ncbi:MAG: tetratricopeptide repeat protein [Gammaproteobacteria bacterium]|nr:tetratricopeptide repeat protein [Gammaproteobacteria bacterium]